MEQNRQTVCALKNINDQIKIKVNQLNTLHLS